MERKSRPRGIVRACLTGLLVFFLPSAVFPQSEKKTFPQKTQIVLLGTGTPSPDPERSGPATAIVLNGTPYLIDFGPGVYRRKHHTSSGEVAEIAKKAPPGLLILYHRANPGGVGQPNPEQVLLEEVRHVYGGRVVIGHDLDVF